MQRDRGKRNPMLSKQREIYFKILDNDTLFDLHLKYMYDILYGSLTQFKYLNYY